MEIATEPADAPVIVEELVRLAAQAADGIVAATLGQIRDAEKAGRTQAFEEGVVLQVGAPENDRQLPEGRYFMALHDVETSPCARLHFHPGPRYLRITTNSATSVLFATTSPIEVRGDRSGIDTSSGFTHRSLAQTLEPLEVRKNIAAIHPCSIVDVRLGPGIVHQLYAIGSGAIVDSLHALESTELLECGFDSPNMAAQTQFVEVSSAMANCPPPPNREVRSRLQ